MKEKLHKYSFLGCLLLAGIVFFTWTDNWQVYTEPLQETYTKGVLLAEQLVEGKWPGISGEQSDAKEEPRNAGTFLLVSRWNSKVPRPANNSVVETSRPVSMGTRIVAPNIANMC